MAKTDRKSVLFGLCNPKSKNGPYLGLSGSKSDSEGTYSTHIPPLVVVSTLGNCPDAHLDPRNGAHLDPASNGLERKLGECQNGSNESGGGPKMTFSKKLSRTTWDATTSGLSLF